MPLTQEFWFKSSKNGTHLSVFLDTSTNESDTYSPIFKKWKYGQNRMNNLSKVNDDDANLYMYIYGYRKQEVV